VSSQLRHISTIGKNLLNSNTSSTRSHNIVNFGSIAADQFTSLGHPSKFQQVSRVGFVTAPTSLNGRQPIFARRLAVSWDGTLYIHFRGSCPLREFCQVQNSLCVQVLRSAILTALLHGNRVVGVSQTLRRWAEGATYIRQGGHHVVHRLLYSFPYFAYGMAPSPMTLSDLHAVTSAVWNLLNLIPRKI